MFDSEICQDFLEAEALNDLLSRWHTWASEFPDGHGFNTVAAGMQQFRVSCQYDTENGAADQAVENLIMTATDACINDVPQPHRTAIWFNARNLSVGFTVWRSVRLPTDSLQRAFLVDEARAMLIKLLAQRGVI